MGKTLTAPYRVWFTFSGLDGQQYETNFSWFVRTTVNHTGYGVPNEKNLRTFIRDYERSTHEGGANAHLGQIVIWKAKVRRNDHVGELVASYDAGSFVVV
jgi:hypothetical protein